ncbi:MAG TPA: YqaA family protein [Agitococcus sp.]|nr:YqaA family protein [Agitococcus sp.]HMV59581.1 YqaA family protein [Agitococcus sp.]HMX98169.1 YqaA family protein [Agitococcus sp.]HMY27439.1 YqaA family protein [Agitococcus sp.]HMY81209.1 YqaA family protein [Agitococcus sp.]
MALFTKMYDMALRWSRHPHAERYLAALSFTESSFFPIPPDVMLAPMSMTKPKKALRFALITTIASVLGGVFGYAIGAMFYHQFLPLFEQLGWSSHFATIDEWFSKWGVLAVIIAGFTPIPYKVFTIAAGFASMALLPFVLASCVGRGARFFLVAGLMAWGGEKMEHRVRGIVEWLGWGLILLIALWVGYKSLT